MNNRVRARCVRTDDGETYVEYRVGDLTYGSLDELQAALRGR